MQDVFAPLEQADYTFLVGLIDSYVNLTDDLRLKQLLAAMEDDETGAARAELDRQLEKEIRYLGSSEVGYFGRMLTAREPGVSFQEIITDVATSLKVRGQLLGTYPEQLVTLVETYATQQFASLTPQEQQAMLEELGVEQEKAAAFIKRSAGVFALPMLIQAFSTIIVEGLIKRIIFGTIARIIGSQLAARLFTFIAGRFPWWLGWVGPIAWTLSIGWTTFDLQGPALRKTIPIVLYLGLCHLRIREHAPPPPA